MWCSMSSTSRRCRAAIFCHNIEFARIVAAALFVKLPRYSGFGVVMPGFGVGVNWPNMKVRMLSSLPNFVTKSCRYLLNCCSTEEMLNSM